MKGNGVRDTRNIKRNVGDKVILSNQVQLKGHKKLSLKGLAKLKS